jgi:butyrate response factor 1
MGYPLSPDKNMSFTPSTPYVHKYKTEMCKNFETYGKCKYGDECSFAHGRSQLMVKSDVSAQYKTKECKKYAQTGYCPYGLRCQFIHGPKD